MGNMLSVGIQSSNILQIVGDVTKKETQLKIINSTMEKWRQIDVLKFSLNDRVNNAGAAFPDAKGTQTCTSDDESFDKTFDLNLKSVIQITRLAIPHLIATKGAIVNISSMASLNYAIQKIPFYAFSKAALDQYTRALALELIERGVRVNSVNPGIIDTKFMNAAGMPQSSVNQFWNFWDEHRNVMPLGVGSTDDIAEAVAFLCDKAKSRYIVGQCLVVDGGTSIVMGMDAYKHETIIIYIYNTLFKYDIQITCNLLTFIYTLIRFLATYIKLLNVEGTYKWSTFYRSSDPENNYKWTIGSSLFFAMNVYTTTGYGSIAPETRGGQWLTIIYGFIFVPVTLVIVRDLGQWSLLYITRTYARLVLKFSFIAKNNNCFQVQNLAVKSAYDNIYIIVVTKSEIQAGIIKIILSNFV
uniref:Ion_trans_2 domain-containing protein n=1 Tax=Heterorhabditis bacteriophora TaxID=37862 RepID=A0A1I7WV71_HETBA